MKVKLKYEIITKDIPMFQKTFSRTLWANNNLYSLFEEEAREYFKGFKIRFNHPGKVIVLSDL